MEGLIQIRPIRRLESGELSIQLVPVDFRTLVWLNGSAWPL